MYLASVLIRGRVRNRKAPEMFLFALSHPARSAEPERKARRHAPPANVLRSACDVTSAGKLPRRTRSARENAKPKSHGQVYLQPWLLFRMRFSRKKGKKMVGVARLVRNSLSPSRNFALPQIAECAVKSENRLKIVQPKHREFFLRLTNRSDFSEQTEPGAFLLITY